MKPATLLVSLWLVGLVLTGYCSPELRAHVVSKEDLEATSLSSITERTVEIAESTGVMSVRDALEDVRGRLHGVEDAVAPTVADLEAGKLALAQPLAGAGGGSGGTPSESGAAPTLTNAAPPEQGSVENIALIGASSMQLALGVALEDELEKRGFTVRRKAKSATGLTNVEHFDWFATTDEVLGGFDADVVIVNFGGNDATHIKLGKHEWAKWGTDVWDETYASRVHALVTKIRDTGAQAILIGMPIMRSAKFSKRMRHLNEVTAAATVAAGGVYVDQWDFAATDDGKYREKVKVDGRERLMRDDDGIHYSRWGGIYVARLLIDRLSEYLGMGAEAAAEPLPASGEPADAGAQPASQPAAQPAASGDLMAAISEPKRFQSAAIGREVRYRVWRPSAPGKYPLILLLHGAGATHLAYHEHLDDELTKLAAAEQVVLVAPHGSDWGDSWWLDGPKRLGADYEKMIADDLIPALEQEYGTTVRGALGYSMGGHGAMSLALRRPGLFAVVSSMSGALDLTEAGSRTALQQRLGTLEQSRKLWEERSVLQLIAAYPDRARALAIKLECGTDDKWIGANRNVHALLDQLGIAHEYREVDGGGHDWGLWGQQVPAQVKWQAARLRALAAQ